MVNFLRILDYLKPYKKEAALNILFNLLTILFSVVSFLMIIPFLQLLFDKRPPIETEPEFTQFGSQYFIDYFYYLMSQYIESFGKEAALIYICVVVVAVFLLKNLFRFLALYFMAPIRNGAVRDIRRNLFKKMLNLPLNFYGKGRKGDLITRMTTDVKEVEHSILSTIEITFKEPVTLIAYLFVMLKISPQLTLFVFAMILITGLVIGRVGKQLKKQSSEVQHRQGLITSIMDETITGLRIIKAFNAQAFMERQFDSENESFFQTMNKMLRRRDLSSPLTEFLSMCIVAVVLWFGGKLVLDAHIDAEQFIGFMVIFSQMIAPAKSFSTAYYNIQRGLASSHRIDEIMDVTDKIPEIENPRPFKSFDQKIEFRGVHFTYNNFDDKQILKNINLTIEKGDMVALVGQSGAGKTTLADLLPRFYDVQEGQILIDGINIKEYKLDDLRRLMGVVSQQSILFNETVFNNIAFGIQDVNQAKVEEAARIANAHDFIIKLENGYQTNIGDAGNQLSGGERQRLTIARAILKNPPILILDEATSSLDSESEKLVQDALVHLMKNRTSIVIAHRLSTIQYADEILVMQDGEIVERGNHIGLLAKEGLYKKLVDLQQF